MGEESFKKGELVTEQGVCEFRMYQEQRELHKTSDLVADIERKTWNE
jgi:hypothetical protein